MQYPKSKLYNKHPIIRSLGKLHHAFNGSDNFFGAACQRYGVGKSIDIGVAKVGTQLWAIHSAKDQAIGFERFPRGMRPFSMRFSGWQVTPVPVSSNSTHCSWPFARQLPPRNTFFMTVLSLSRTLILSSILRSITVQQMLSRFLKLMVQVAQAVQTLLE